MLFAIKVSPSGWIVTKVGLRAAGSYNNHSFPILPCLLLREQKGHIAMAGDFRLAEGL